MLQLTHLLERRFGAGSPSWIRTRLLLASLLLLALGLGIANQARAQDANADAQALATQLLDHLDAGKYAEAEELFSADMAKAVPADKLKAVWESLPAQVGAAKGRGDATVSAQGGAVLAAVPLFADVMAAAAGLCLEKPELTRKAV